MKDFLMGLLFRIGHRIGSWIGMEPYERMKFMQVIIELDEPVVEKEMFLKDIEIIMDDLSERYGFEWKMNQRSYKRVQ